MTPAADLDVGENPCERPHIVNQVHPWRDTLLLQRLVIGCGHPMVLEPLVGGVKFLKRVHR